MNKLNISKKEASLEKSPYDSFYRIDKFCKLAVRGSKNDIREMEYVLKNDPKKLTCDYKFKTEKNKIFNGFQ